MGLDDQGAGGGAGGGGGRHGGVGGRAGRGGRSSGLGAQGRREAEGLALFVFFLSCKVRCPRRSPWGTPRHARPPETWASPPGPGGTRAGGGRVSPHCVRTPLAAPLLPPAPSRSPPRAQPPACAARLSLAPPGPTTPLLGVPIPGHQGGWEAGPPCGPARSMQPGFLPPGAAGWARPLSPRQSTAFFFAHPPLRRSPHLPASLCPQTPPTCQPCPTPTTRSTTCTSSLRTRARR